MNPHESDVVLVKRKVNGEEVAVKMDKAKYDADPEAYELWDEKKPAKAGKKDGDGDDDKINKAPEGQLIVGKNGKSGRGSKFVILDDQGKKFVDDEFDTEAEAFAALGKLTATAPAAEGNGQ